jgi:hypothetical protein
MEFSFARENSADASFLARELELDLRRAGVPTAALSLKQSSPENMDIGSVLSMAVDLASIVLGPAASVATVARCIYDVVNKYNCTIIMVGKDGKPVKIRSTVTFKRLENMVAKSVHSDGQSGSKE